MGKMAFIFAGQGAQTIGMGKELAQNFKVADDTFNEASEALGIDMKKMIWEGNSETLMITENTQPAILTMSTAALRVVQELGVKPDVVAGLSLGEYTAHVAAGSIDFVDAVKLVKKRGKFMQEEVPFGVGGMAAILNLTASQVVACCEKAKEFGIVEPANFNCPGQITVAGEIKAVEKCCEIAKEMGAKRAIMLPVSAPFHCSMLRGAGLKLKEELKNVEVKDLKYPLITNVTANYVLDKEHIKDFLVRQVSSSVLFESSIKKMLDLKADLDFEATTKLTIAGVDTFIEIGPGKALSGFVKKIEKQANTYNVEDMASLNVMREGLGI